jgi:single-strand DNA-binding protein
MSIGLNHTTMAGNLVKDPDVKYLKNDKVVCKITIANSQKYKVNGEQKEDVIFLDCSAWGSAAENIGKYFKKGKPIIVEGKLKQENWEDKDTGAKRSKIVMSIDRFHFVPDGKAKESSNDGSTIEDKHDDKEKRPETKYKPQETEPSDEPPF